MTNGQPTRARAGRATLYVALGACGFGTISIFVSIATRAGAPLMGVLAWRYLLALPPLLVAAWLAGALRFDAHAVRTMALAGLGQSIIAIVTLSALDYISAATLSFLFYTFPAWVALIARIRHSEPLTPVRLLALALSLLGIGVMVGGPGGTVLHPIGVALALIGAVIYAAYIPMLASLQKHSTPVATAAWMSGGAAIILSAVALFHGELTIAMAPAAWASTTALALLSTAAAFLWFLKGLGVLGAVRTAIVSTIEPFFTALLGTWVLAQPLTRWTLIGGGLIGAAVILLQLKPTDENSGLPS